MQAVATQSLCAGALTQRRAVPQLAAAPSRPAAARRQAVRVRAEGEAAPAPGIETKGPNMVALKVGVRP